MRKKGYPRDISDEEWEFIAPYLTLMKEEASKKVYELREISNALRRIVRTGHNGG